LAMASSFFFFLKIQNIKITQIKEPMQRSTPFGCPLEGNPLSDHHSRLTPGALQA
jgi:hypothetical protein